MSLKSKIFAAAVVSLVSVSAFAADPLPGTSAVDSSALIDQFLAAMPVGKVAQAVASICISMIGLVAIGFAYDQVKKRFKG
ncbi:hypothetical protein [Chromobacterium sp. IIBBL 290-4]|uniref:hypothetical protein n=1 Tax=Chromobacterium sp. IIBBL 290-4 TaxID=2953890 RepID=UPI0020B8A732|nr:hypothetical protein [Chromobacterium sp. IIBBL 290-4]UTH73584.1 hypothetical protein NKT35_18885 [Chromobacterium sp. IIBBL 290-4]